jgi:type IV secretory pathway TrbD component
MVWGYQGLWCKLLGRAPRHLAIVQDALGGSAHLGLAAIGAAECALAVWVLSGRRPVAAAASQTALLAAMNAGGILWAPREIPDIPGMLLANFAFVVLAWEVAYANR